jgi:hypothetical protein
VQHTGEKRFSHDALSSCVYPSQKLLLVVMAVPFQCSVVPTHQWSQWP